MAVSSVEIVAYVGDTTGTMRLPINPINGRPPEPFPFESFPSKHIPSRRVPHNGRTVPIASANPLSLRMPLARRKRIGALAAPSAANRNQDQSDEEDARPI